MKILKKLLHLLWILPLLYVILALIGHYCIPPKSHVAELSKLRSDYNKQVLRMYRQTVLSLYDPPTEAFTPNGYALMMTIQKNYSKTFLPYLVMGSTPVHPDVLYNPFFDVLILIKDSDGLIDGVALSSSLSGDQVPQRELTYNYWTQFYKRYLDIKAANVSSIREFHGFDYIVAQMRNMTNKYHWPGRLYLTAKHPFDLYIQQPLSAIYCSSIEPGAYVMFNIANNSIKTNIMALQPFQVEDMVKRTQAKIDSETADMAQLIKQKAATEKRPLNKKAVK